jgi:uncharacterized membrane protein (DUF485 family)
MMRFSLKPIFFPLLVITTFSFSVFWLATRQHDRGFAWIMAIGSVVVAVIGNALYVYTTDNRIRDLEAKLERLSTKVWNDGSK